MVIPMNDHASNSVRLFTSQRTQSAPSHATIPMTLPHKVAWVDVPKHIHWFLSMVSKHPSSSQPGNVAKQYIHASETWHPDYGVNLEAFKQALTFMNQYRLHTFTWFWKDGVKRWRMVKKPSMDILTSYNKRGLAANIQDNRFWVHYSFNIDVFDKGFHALLPVHRMAYLKQNDKKQLESIQSFNGRISLAHERLKAHMDTIHTQMLKGIEEAMKLTLGTSQMSMILAGEETGLKVALNRTHAEAMQAFTDTLTEMESEFVFDENKVAGKVALNSCKNNFVDVMLLFNQLKYMRTHIEQQVSQTLVRLGEGELWYPDDSMFTGTEASA